MLEGALIWNKSNEDDHDGSGWFIGENMYTVFNRLAGQISESERPGFLKPIEDILEGKQSEDVQEHTIGKPSPGTRLAPATPKVA